MGYRTVMVDVEVDLDDIPDRDIVSEVIERELVEDVAEALAKRGKERKDIPQTTRQLAEDVYRWLMVNRPDGAHVAMRKLLEALVPAPISAAEAAMREGRYNEAICELDDLFPSPTTNPKVKA